MAPKGFKYLIESFDDILLKIEKRCKACRFSLWLGRIYWEEQAEIKRRGLETYFHFLPFQENPARLSEA